MRRVVFAALLLSAAPLFAQSTFSLHGYLAARSVRTTDDQESWLAGGFGRLDSGGKRTESLGTAQVGADWQPSHWFDLHVSGAARRYPERYDVKDYGLIDAYADVRVPVGRSELQLRAGQFFLPTSRENIDQLWASPYTVNFSTINTWIGEEVRPLGADLQWRYETAGGNALTLAGTGFRGNDTMGTLLAWRGWTVGNHLAVRNEVLPLPPLEIFQSWFWRQMSDGTKPLGKDLDGRNGYSARIRYSMPQRMTLQYTWLDNRGDRLLHDGEYAWATTFHLAGADFGNPDTTILATEYMTGTTGMGREPSYVDASFRSAYVLLSQKQGRSRWTARYDLFRVSDRDESSAGSSRESGHSWTAAYLYDLSRGVRIAAEYTDIKGKRPPLADDNLDPATEGKALTLEARYRF